MMASSSGGVNKYYGEPGAFVSPDDAFTNQEKNTLTLNNYNSNEQDLYGAMLANQNLTKSQFDQGTGGTG